ncbi:hypothetical protein [Flavobacterium johnsoniae]|jgi:hypothetical protein|uniref:hypothetical protein n=1 Tax=Flavobacterium johnsoniae TaxID=986 RepID=UPI0011EC5DDC|nr:hypothetical protein [Flavobacterium johnsoniae]
MKKYLLPGFWMLYMLFFAIPFPMIIYYAVSSEFDITTLKDKDPWLALSLVAVSLILWLIVIIGFFQKWILSNFITKQNLENIKRNGVIREAKILKAVKISGNNAKYNTYELELLFKNLADTEITHRTEISDTKPHERRFEAGKKLNLILNREPKKLPVFVIANSEGAINPIGLALRVLGWLLVLALVGGYYFYSYQDESHGMGWRFMSFGHPLIICPLVLIFYRYLLRFILNKLTGANGDSVLIKFKGIKTWAKLINVSQTGTYINEQPMMRFELEYTDNKHHVHRKSLKKIVGLLELDITKKEQVEIFYLAENPNLIALADDLKKM